MYIFQEDGEKLMKSLRAEMLGALSARFDFFKALMDEDDWSFVIKLHALIETVTTQAIISAINDERLKAVIERLPLSDDEVGKLRIAKDLGLYSKGQRTFVRRLSTLRNQIVHNVDNLGFTFASYIESLDHAQKASWQNALCWFQEGKDVSDYWRIASLRDPKLATWLSGFMLTSLTLVNENEIVGKRRIRDSASETTSKLVAALLQDGEKSA